MSITVNTWKESTENTVKKTHSKTPVQNLKKATNPYQAVVAPPFLSPEQCLKAPEIQEMEITDEFAGSSVILQPLFCYFL